MDDRSPVETAVSFVDVLDRNDAAGMSGLFDPDGTWWVDTGLDRAAGADDVDPGDDRPWPLHGNMPLGEKVALLEGLPTRFPHGCRQRRWHSFGDGSTAVVEVDGEGQYVSGAMYQNRYAFVVDVSGGQVTGVREYLDTAHAADVFSGRHLDRRTTGPAPTDGRIDDGPLVELATLFVRGLGAADPDVIAPLAHDDATWWADTGQNRPAGRRDVDPYRGPRAPLVGLAALHDRIVHLPGITRMFSLGWRLAIRRVISGRDAVAVEVASDATREDGTRYQNRYCFVLDVRDGRISQVREYCDTLHVFDVFGVPRIARIDG